MGTTCQADFFEADASSLLEWSVSKSTAPVPPNARRSHYHELDSRGKAPVPYIKFHYNTGDPDNPEYKTYKLGFYATDEDDSFRGKKYIFRYSGNSLDLKAAD